jgi:glutathione peroxidase
MTIRQRLLKLVYPLWMWYGQTLGKNNLILHGDTTPLVSFYDLQSTLNNGEKYDFNQLRGKKVLIVNTASDCGYTKQYEGLEELYKKYAGKLVVLGFPSNDFKEQEKGDDKAIAEFCRVNFGVSFPLMQKTAVLRGGDQHPVYQWLTDPAKNGWNKKQPSWNFSKYLVNEQGSLVNYFGSTIAPFDKGIIHPIDKL